MAVIGVLSVIFSGNNAPLLAAIASSEVAMKGYVAGNVSGAALASKAVAGIGIGALAGMGLAISAAASFQEQMATVNTIARLTPEALADIGGEVRDLSVATGIGLPDLTQGLYDLLSVGVPVGRAMEVLGDATTLSIGGVSTAGEAVNAITTAINSWSIAGGNANLTMDDSAKVMDIFAKTVEIGGLTAADIPGALANVASSAAALNVPLEEVGAAWAILTTRGFTASEAATSMDAALTALQKKPPGMEKLEEATGKSYEAIARTEGAQEAMQQLVTDAQTFGIQLVDVFGRKEALGYARNITDAGAPAFKAALDAMFDSSGTAVDQASERMGTFSRQMDILGTSINNLGISVGTGLLPFVTSLVDKLNGIVQGVTDWAAKNPELAGSILPVIAGVGLLALAVLGVGAVAAVLASPIVLFVAAVGIAVGIVMSNLDNLKLGIQTVIDKFNEFLGLAASVPGVQLLGDINRNSGSNYEQALAGYGQPPGPTYAPSNPMIDLARGGRVGQGMFGGGMARDRGAPIQVNRTTNINLDGKKLVGFFEKEVYNDASQFSSGFAGGELR